jgi:hypothetical protein
MVNCGDICGGISVLFVACVIASGIVLLIFGAI